MSVSVPNHSVSVVDELPLSAITLLDRVGGLIESEVSPVFERDFPENYADEESLFRENLHHAEKTRDYEMVRRYIRDALQIMAMSVHDRVGDVFSSNGGLDIGSGSSGEMVKLLPPFVDRDSWVLTDVNDYSIAMLRERFLKNPIFNASYLSLSKNLEVDGNVPCVTGLSCLDSTIFIEKAVQEIRDALLSGGSFFHVQDAIPNRGLLFRELYEQGETPPFKCKIDPISGEPLLYKVGEKFVEPVELFRQHLVKAINSTQGLELVFDQYVVVESLVSEKAGLFTPGGALAVDGTDIQLGEKFNRLVAAHVLVAKKAA